LSVPPNAFASRDVSLGERHIQLEQLGDGRAGLGFLLGMRLPEELAERFTVPWCSFRYSTTAVSGSPIVCPATPIGAAW